MPLPGVCKTRIVTVGVAVGLAAGTLSLGVASSAAAGPLDPDRSFGRNPDGSVRSTSQIFVLGPPRTMGVWRKSTYLAGPTMGGGSGESLTAVARHGRHGRLRDYFHGSLAEGDPWGAVATTFRSGRRVFSIGWAPRVNYGPPYGGMGGFGFVAAFQPRRPKGARWGTDRFGDGDRGLERLREVPLASVAAGAIDSHRRVVVVGRDAGDVIVTRLTAKGSIDQSFGGSGYIRLRNGAGTARAFDVAIDKRQRILVAGELSTGTGRSHGFVARLARNGTPSDTWSGDGVRWIGAAGSAVRGIESARHGRWLVGYERQRADTVRLVKLGQHGGQLTSFGHQGRVIVRCGAPEHGPSLTAMTVSRERAGRDRLAAIMNCQRSGERHQRAGIWFTDGSPVPALAPSGTGRLPWSEVTVDAKYTDHGKLMLLHGGWLTRLHG